MYLALKKNRAVQLILKLIHDISAEGLLLAGWRSGAVKEAHLPCECQMRAGLGLWVWVRQVAASCRCFHKEVPWGNAQPAGCNLNQVLTIPHPNT